VEIEDRGVAPFYYDWPVEFGVLDTHGSVVKTFSGGGKLSQRRQVRWRRLRVP